MERRGFVRLVWGVVPALGFWKLNWSGQALAGERIGKLVLDNAEWKKRLTPGQYDILREEGTERPFTSPLSNEKHRGLFVCLACDLPLFPAKFKYDSGTGWPSFFDVLTGHVETKTDLTLLPPRTEYHCARCGGHHGHVFNDGTKPTGLRYCNNGLVLKFVHDKT